MKKCDKIRHILGRIACSRAATRRSRLKNLDYFGSGHHNHGRFGNGGGGKDAEFFGQRRFWAEPELRGPRAARVCPAAGKRGLERRRRLAAPDVRLLGTAR